MSGGRIEKTKEALQYFVRALPEGCKFNIIETVYYHITIIIKFRYYIKFIKTTINC